MKDINLNQTVINEITRKGEELTKLCVKHGLPVVIGILVNRNESGIAKFASIHYDLDSGAFDNSIAACAQLLRIKNVPKDVIILLKQMADNQNVMEVNIDTLRNKIH